MTHISLVNDVDGKNVTLELSLSLDTVAANNTPPSFAPSTVRGGVAIAPGQLPSNPSIGTIAIDSNDSNKLKWWTGEYWVTAGS